jgi:hypothetical protein
MIATCDRRLDDADKPALQRRERNDHLGRIAERSVQQATDAGARSLREPFGGLPASRGEWHDRPARDDEDRHVPLGRPPFERHRGWQEGQQPIDARSQAHGGASGLA